MKRTAMCVVLAGLLGCSGPAVTKRAGKMKTPVSGEELKKALVGKTQDEVRELLGDPDDTMNDGSEQRVWIYRDVILDADSHKTNPAYVRFRKEDGKIICRSATTP